MDSRMDARRTGRPDRRALMLLDTASLYFRAFYGVPDSVRAPDGSPVNAVRGLLDFLTRLVSDHHPAEIVACWDDDWRPQWRVDLVPTYKAHRLADAEAGTNAEDAPAELERQVPVIREVLESLGVAVLGAADCEADDVIGTLTARATRPVDIVTGDRDLFQLVEDDRAVRLLYTARGVGRLEIVDEAAIAKRYGIPGRSYADFATLRGDPSDGLPGVPGVGDKTAAMLIRTYGDLDAIVAAAADPGSGMAAGLRRKIVAATDYLPAARDVVRVASDAALPVADSTIPTSPYDPARWQVLVERWGLGSSARRLTEVLAPSGG